MSIQCLENCLKLVPTILPAVWQKIGRVMPLLTLPLLQWENLVNMIELGYFALSVAMSR